MKILAKELKDRIYDLLVCVGESPENAEIASEYMMLCDARGVVTHGSHMAELVCDRRDAGQLDLPTALSVELDEGASVLIDGNDGLGQVAADRACEMAVRKAKQYGIGIAMIRNTNNVGALGPYVEKIARQGFVALMCCNASPAMAPWGGMAQFIGTQPFAIGIYTGKEQVFSADMATATVARGKIRKAMREEKPIPEGWALDKYGRSTTDPAAAMEGVLLPMSGPKGSAMALSIDIIAGMLSGSSYAPNVRAIHYPEGRAGIGVSLIVLDIERYMGLPEFQQKMESYIDSIRSMKKAEGVERIFIPGEIEQTRLSDSLRDGIELTDAAVKLFNDHLERHGIEKLRSI